MANLLRTNHRMIDGSRACLTDFAAPGATDFVAAFNAAAASFGGSGGKIIVPPGSYPLGSAITLPDGVCIEGSGSFGTILQPTTAGDAVFITGHANKLSGFQINPTVTRSGGIDIDVQGNQIEIEDCYMVGYYVGINVGTFGGPIRVGTQINGCYFNGVAASGSCAIICQNGSNVVVDRCVITGPSSGLQPDAGVRVRHVDTFILSNTNITRHGKALFVDPGNTMFVGAMKVVNCLFDSAGQVTSGSYVPCVDVTPASGSAVVNISFEGCWIGLAEQSQGCNLLPAAGGSLNGVTFDGCDFADNYDYGLLIAGATVNVTVDGGFSEGHATVGGAGIRLAGTCDNITITNHRSGDIAGRGANDYGIVIDASVVGFYKIDGCNLRGNTTAGILDGGGSSTRQIRNSAGYVTENGGSGLILSGTTSITVNHGLARTPTLDEIWITPSGNSTNDPGNMWVDTINATQFTIHCRNNPGASNLGVFWGARLK